MLRDSTPRFVGPSVRRSVGPSHFTFSAFMGFLAIPLLPKYSTDLKYGPCPPARDWGSRVSGLVILPLLGPLKAGITKIKKRCIYYLCRKNLYSFEKSLFIYVKNEYKSIVEPSIFNVSPL